MLSGGDQVSLLRDFFFSRGGHPLLDQLGFEPKDTSQQLSNRCMPLLPLTRTNMLSCRLSHPSSRQKSYGSRGLGSAVPNAQPSPPAISNAESLAFRLLEDHSRAAANRMVTLKSERHAMIRTVPQMATPKERDV